MDVSPQDVKDLGDDLADLTDARVQIYIDIAKTMVSPASWGANYDTAVKLLAAHFAAQAASQGGTAPVQSVKLGAASITYGSTATEREGLGASEYGAMYLQLLEALSIPFLVT